MTLLEQLRRSWPACARCVKPVETWEIHEDPIDGTVTLVAKCHGAEDRATLTIVELALANDIRCTSAFEAYDEALS